MSVLVFWVGVFSALMYHLVKLAMNYEKMPVVVEINVKMSTTSRSTETCLTTTSRRNSV